MIASDTLGIGSVDKARILLCTDWQRAEHSRCRIKAKKLFLLFRLLWLH